MSFQIKKSLIVEMLNREMESYQSFQKNIDNQVEELRTSLHAVDDKHFADGICKPGRRRFTGLFR